MKPATFFARSGRCLASLFVFVLAGRAGFPANVTEESIRARIASSPKLARSHIGLLFQDVESGEAMAASESGTFYTPASNTKLYTTALALVRLGATFTFRTEARTSSAWKDGEVKVPDVILEGGGDPNLSGRVLPYAEGAKPGDPLAAIRALADQIAAKGITTVAGDISGDDSRYPYDPYPDGWTIDDGLWAYGAPVSALCVNDNAVKVTAAPAALGDLASVKVEPEVGELVLLNEVVTGAGRETRITAMRPPGSNELILAGTIGQGAPPYTEDFAVTDPALFAARALTRELEQRGIGVLGEPRAKHLALSQVPDPLRAALVVNTPQGAALAALTSAPLWQDVQVINKVSQNLHAEILLREVARGTRGVGTLQAGVDERRTFLHEAALSDWDQALADGSGLARQNLTSPAATVALLRYMWRRPEQPFWVASLPVGGKDGSLEHRFHGVGGAERVHAKTGTLAHVAALSGYLQTAGGRWIAFSLMANGGVDDAAEITAFFDEVCGQFLAAK